MKILVCRKWVDRRPRVDPLSAKVSIDVRTSGASDADDAALEWGLQLAEAWGLDVEVVTAGGPEAEVVCRDGLGAGCTRAWRVPTDFGAPSEAVAIALAEVASATGAVAVLCGDMSLDRGSGAVPALVAHHLGAAQALGLVSMSPGRSCSDPVEAWRRLDGGRREHLRLRTPFVASFEGSSARLRRAALSTWLASHQKQVELFVPRAAQRADQGQTKELTASRVDPYRPRTHVVRAPTGSDARSRVLELLGGLRARPQNKAVELEAEDAADAILQALKEWGERP